MCSHSHGAQADFQCTVQRLLNKLKLPELQDRRKQLRLILFFKVVEGLVPAIPADKFTKQQKPGRLIRSSTDKNFISSNTRNSYIRNNDRCFVVHPCRTEQLRNSFFCRTCGVEPPGQQHRPLCICQLIQNCNILIISANPPRRITPVIWALRRNHSDSDSMKHGKVKLWKKVKCSPEVLEQPR